MTENEAKVLLLEVAAQLDRWALESMTGGWSTYQVKPMIALSEKITRLVVLGQEEE